MLDALVRADVPSVLGYRWSVDDQGALKLAKAFYESLWKTLSPGRALLAARRSVSMEVTGSDDETWASPVLVQQTP
jgi:CHAT domain-containing protein